MDSNTPAPDPKRCPPVPSIPPAPGDTGITAIGPTTTYNVEPWARDAMAPQPSVDDEIAAGRMLLSATPPPWRLLIVALAISIPVLVVGIGVLSAAMDGVAAP